MIEDKADVIKSEIFRLGDPFTVNEIWFSLKEKRSDALICDIHKVITDLIDCAQIHEILWGGMGSGVYETL